MNIKKLIADSIAVEIDGVDFEKMIIESVFVDNGDYCLPCFALAKTLHKSPMLIAEEISSSLKVSQYIEHTECKSGYLNFFLDKSKVAEEIIDELKSISAFKNEKNNKIICIDYSSVNLAKYMHIGHLKNTIIGESIARICENLGYKVVRINYIGDYGTPFGKIIAAYKMWGNSEDVDRRGIDALQDLYVKFNQEAEINPELEEVARNYFKKIEEKDEEIYPLYQRIINIAVKEAERLLNILGVKFDSWRGESYYSEQLDKVVNMLNSKNLTKVSEGALIVDLSQFDMPPCLIRRSDGASLYATRDIAAAIDRYDNYKFDKMFYVTGHEQMLHFKQFFKVLELAGYDFSKNLEHIHYGLFSLPTGKISSRKGKQATLVDLIDYAKSKANEVIKDRTFTIEKPDDVAWKVARGALNFNALKVEVGKDCLFDVDKAFSFDGETAPYMQYSYTRIESILRKAKELKVNSKADYSVLTNEAFELVKSCNNVRNAIEQAFTKREPSMVVKCAMDICKTLNKYYASTKVLDGESAQISAKINMLGIVKNALTVLFHLICIDTLQEM